MCDPSGGALTGLVIGLTALSAYNQYQVGQEQKSIARQNAKLADEQAVDTVRRGKTEEDRRRRLTRQQIGSQRAAFGANNVVSSTGTPLGLLADTAEFGELDALTIRNNAAREAFGFKIDSQNFRRRAKLAGREGTVGAATTLIGGGTQAFGDYRRNKALGA